MLLPPVATWTTFYQLILALLLIINVIQSGGGRQEHKKFDACEVPGRMTIRETADAAHRGSIAFRQCNSSRFLPTLIHMTENRTSFNDMSRYVCVAYRLAFMHMHVEGCGERQKTCTDSTFFKKFEPKFMFMMRYGLIRFVLGYGNKQQAEIEQFLEKCALGLQPRSISSSLYAIRWFRNTASGFSM